MGPRKKAPKNDLFPVEAIRQHKWENDKPFFEIKWENYKESDNTWQSFEDVEVGDEALRPYVEASSDERLKKYYREHSTATGPANMDGIDGFDNCTFYSVTNHGSGHWEFWFDRPDGTRTSHSTNGLSEKALTLFQELFQDLCQHTIRGNGLGKDTNLQSRETDTTTRKRKPTQAKSRNSQRRSAKLRDARGGVKKR